MMLRWVLLLGIVAIGVCCEALQSAAAPPLLDVPTYSMATQNADGSTTNMNILTYATPVSIKPERVWTLGLFKGTLSEENFRRTRTCVLQFLTEEHAPIVKCLGGSSGNDVDKSAICSDLGFPWTECIPASKDSNGESDDSLQLLPGCSYYLKLTAVGDFVEAGCHVIAPYCRVDGMYVIENGNKPSPVQVSTGRLRELGIITAQGRVAED